MQDRSEGGAAARLYDDERDAAAGMYDDDDHAHIHEQGREGVDVYASDSHERESDEGRDDDGVDDSDDRKAQDGGTESGGVGDEEDDEGAKTPISIFGGRCRSPKARAGPGTRGPL